MPPGGRDISTPKPSEPLSPRPVNKKVTHLFLNPTLTGAADFDSRPGDEIEPLGESGSADFVGPDLREEDVVVDDIHERAEKKPAPKENAT